MQNDKNPLYRVCIILSFYVIIVSVALIVLIDNTYRLKDTIQILKAELQIYTLDKE